MTAALTLLVGAVFVGTLAPAALGRLDLRRRDPVPLIGCWLLAMVGVLATAVAGIGLLLLPDHGLGHAILTGTHGCWSAVQHGTTPRIEELVGAVAMLLTVALVARCVLLGRRAARRRADQRAEHLAMLRLAARRYDTAPTTPTTLWLPHDRPLAFSLAGRPGVVVATDGLTRHLGSTEVTAVLEHERAHLRGHHHLLVAVTDVLAAAFPYLRLFRQAPAAIRELAEIAADINAVRACGADAVRSALATVTGTAVPTMALAMGQDAVDLRLARLRCAPATPNPLWRAACCAATGTVAAVLPLLAGTGLLMAMATIACQLTG